jgi:hypothetical protein
MSVALRNVKVDGPGGSSPNITWRTLIPIFVIGAFPVVIPYLASPALPHPLLSPYNKPGSPVRILSSVQSVTGLIVVGESLPSTTSSSGIPTLRYLRAAHSLLGGVWIGDQVHRLEDDPQPSLDASGTPIGDSIYYTFLVQESVRMVDKKNRKIPEEGETALIMCALSTSLFVP